MKYAKQVVLAALSVMALMGFGVSSASATTFEISGTTQNSSITINVSLAPGTSAIWKDTFGFPLNTCVTSLAGGTTSSPFTGTSVTWQTSSLLFEACTRTVTVHAPGQLEVTWTSGTNGTIASEGTELTVGSPFGHVTCTTGETTKLGTLTGVASGNAVLDINAVMNCVGVGTAKWEAAYLVTSPNGLGVSS